MNILVTNDDGVLAPGLSLLADVCRQVGSVTVVAPDREQSGTSHSLTLHRPLRPARRPDGGWQIDGTPTDCVMLAIQALMPERPDFVFSGVNHGPNMGEDVLYSGTVAAAMEAVTLGVRGIGISFAGNQPETMATYHGVLLELVRRITSVADFPEQMLLNINLPRIPAEEVRGIQVTKLGSRYFSESLTRMKDPWGREIYWIGGGTITWTGGENSDHLAVAEGYISVTPLHMDLDELLSPGDGPRMVLGGVGEGDSYGGYRSQLVEVLRRKGVRDLAVLRAVRMVPRHLFVPESVRHRAYDDVALPIGSGQTISQPYVQARYLELIGLTGKEKVLEIGTGSGYQTALLALLASMVFSVERVAHLAQSARAALEAAGIRNVTVLVGDGTLGWRPYAPYDSILVSAASPEVPTPLVEQLASGGKMVIPLGDRDAQTLTLVERRGDQVRSSTIADVRFVPLVGEFGFSEER